MLQKTEFIWFDGKLVPWDQAQVHVLAHGLHYKHIGQGSQEV